MRPPTLPRSKWFLWGLMLGVPAVALFSLRPLEKLGANPDLPQVSSDQAAKHIPVLAPSPQRKREISPGKGKFLIATRGLRDPNFFQTVVLLIEYGGDKGAMGLIVNRPTDVKLSDLIEIPGAERRGETIYIGGPVAKTGILVLIRSASQPADSNLVLDDIYVSASRPLLEELVGSSEGGENFRLYAGYAGWAAGQLEFELDRGSWHVLPAEADMVFDPQPEKVWKRLIDRTSIRFARIFYPAVRPRSKAPS